MRLHQKTFDSLTVPELYELLRIRSAVFVVEQACVYQDMDGIDRDALHLWLTEDERVLAYLRVFPDGTEPDTVRIGRVLTVDRGRGYGAALMGHGITAAREHFGAKRIRLEAQTYAVGFYEKAGFAVCSETYLEDGIPHQDMLLTIT